MKLTALLWLACLSWHSNMTFVGQDAGNFTSSTLTCPNCQEVYCIKFREAQDGHYTY